MVGRVVLAFQPENARIVRGAVSFEGSDLLRMAEREREDLLGRDIALIPQNPMTALNRVARIEPQMTDVLVMHLALGRQAARTRALGLLRDVHIRQPKQVLRRFPH